MKYFFNTSVTNAQGTQRWYVEADSLKAAKAGYAEGTLDIILDEEELEVEDDGKPEWEDDE